MDFTFSIRKVLMLSLIITSNFAFSQSRLSPKFYAFNKRINYDTIKVSIAIRDIETFKNNYKNQITIQYSYRQSKTIIAKAPYALANTFALDPNILFVDMLNNPVAEAGTDYFNIAFNKVNKVRNEFGSLQGKGHNVLIKEQRFDTASIDLKNRSFKTSIAASTSSQHATTIATIIAGGGNESYKTEGIASEALIGSSDFFNLLPDPNEIFTANDIHLENHSYGVGIENYYGNEAAAYDQQVYDNPTIVHVFSSGNLGTSTPKEGNYATLNFANLSGNFKHAKNILTVTSADTSFTVNERNSKGPAYDGRIKPDLTAFGQDGTSDAAALLSGVCILIQQQYKALYNRYPTAVEVKSILVASADDIGSSGIDYTSGYGNVNAYRAISLVKKQQMVTVSVPKGSVTSIPITVPPAIRQLRLVVSWIDLPATQNSKTALVDDIDAVIEGNKEIIYPWVLSSVPLTDSLNAVARRRPDHLNPTEYFTIDEPIAGNYNLKIDASKILSSTTNVSVAYWYDENELFEWNYPTSYDKIESNKRTTLMWNVWGKQTGTLYFQYSGGDWQTIKENIQLGDYFQWLPPDTMREARLKMKIGEQEFLTEMFLITPIPKLMVAFNCESDFALAWDAIPGVSEYNVYTMGYQYLKLLKTVKDPSVALTKSANYYYAIAPVLNQSTGIKTQTIQYADQGALCYINLFDAQRYEPDRITLQLNLSSTLNVAQVIFYKVLYDDSNALLNKIENPTSTQQVSFDYALNDNVMRYKATVVLTSGVHLESEVRTVYIETKDKVILFPNPVIDNELKILSEGKDLEVSVVNALGTVLFTKEITSNIENLDVSILPAGLYIVQLLRNSKQIDSKKFLKK